VSALQLAVNAAVGGWFGGATVTVLEVLPVAPWLSVTVTVTVYVPPAAYVWAGFCDVAVFPSPKLQLQAVICPSASVLPSVNAQLSAQQLVVNPAVGGLFAATVTPALSVLDS